MGDEQEMSDGKEPGTSYQRDHLTCDHMGSSKEQGSCGVTTAQGGTGRVGTEVGGGKPLRVIITLAGSLLAKSTISYYY